MARQFIDKEFYGFEIPDRADAFLEWLKDRLDETHVGVDYKDITVQPQIIYDAGGDEYAGFSISYWWDPDNADSL
jgi:hypothetical protein